MSEPKLDLSIIIVSWNVRQYLKPCLQSICRATHGLQTEILVIDNASRDGSAEMVAQEFPNVKLIANDTNRGFGQANNQGLQSCKSDFVLLINPDTLVPQDAIHKMIAFLQAHPRAGLAGPEQRDENGKVHLGNCVRIRPRELLECIIERLASAGNRRTRIIFSRPRRVPILNAGCWMVRREAMMEIGLFDEDLFMYAEEPDVCNRLSKAGWEKWFLRHIEIVHYRRKSINQRGKLTELYLFFHSMLIWLKKLWRQSEILQAVRSD